MAAAPPAHATPLGTRLALASLAVVLLLCGALILGVVLLGGRMGDRVTVERMTRYVEGGVALVARNAERQAEGLRAAALAGGGRDAVIAALAGHAGLDYAALFDGERRLVADLSPRSGAAEAALATGLAVSDLVPRDGRGARAAVAVWEGRPHVLVRVWLEEGALKLVAKRPLDEAVFQDLVGAFATAPPRFGAPGEAGPGEIAIPLALPGGGGAEAAGHLLIRADLSGRRIVRGTVLPIAAAAVAVVLGLGFALLLLLRRAARAAAEREARARVLAAHDELTGLLNRRGFEARLAALAEGGGGGAAVALLDLDHFKRVNDTLGHHAGDALIRLAADRLRAALPEGAVAARLGGDEFALAAPLPPARGGGDGRPPRRRARRPRRGLRAPAGPARPRHRLHGRRLGRAGGPGGAAPPRRHRALPSEGRRPRAARRVRRRRRGVAAPPRRAGGGSARRPGGGRRLPPPLPAGGGRAHGRARRGGGADPLEPPGARPRLPGGVPAPRGGDGPRRPHR